MLRIKALRAAPPFQVHQWCVSTRKSGASIIHLLTIYTPHYSPSFLLTTHINPLQSLHNNLQIRIPNTTFSRTLEASDIHHAVLVARLDAAAFIIGMPCTPVGVRVSLTMATIDSATATTGLILDSDDRDVRERQVVVELAADAGVQGVVRVRQLFAIKSQHEKFPLKQ